MENSDIVFWCALVFSALCACAIFVCLLCINDWKKVLEKIHMFFSIVFSVAVTVFCFGSFFWFCYSMIDLLFLREPAKPEEPRISYSYEYETEAPEPYWYDEYGFRYELVYGTTDEYCLDESYEEELDTPDSSAFFSIGYHPYGKKLWVVFRNTGNAYYYYDVPYEVWHDFKNADSKGSYFQECIRDYYEYERD